MSLLPVQGGLLQKHTSADKHSGAKDVSGLRGEVRKRSHFPGRLHCEPLGLHPPGPLETLNHAWECLTQGRGELGYGPSISHRPATGRGAPPSTLASVRVRQAWDLGLLQCGLPLDAPLLKLQNSEKPHGTLRRHSWAKFWIKRYQKRKKKTPCCHF